MAERGACDVWLLRLDGDDKTRLLAASRLLRVDVRMAQHILDNLPRLIARAVAPDAGRKLAQQIHALGGVGHVCTSGEAPDFKGIAGAAERRAVASRTRRSGEVAAEAARAVQDAAMVRWPDSSQVPYAWEAEDAQLPPSVPTPVRHSAARIAAVLLVVIAVLAGGATTYWVHFGDELTRVSAASWRTPDAGASSENDGGVADEPASATADASVGGTAPALRGGASFPADEAVLAPPPQ